MTQIYLKAYAWHLVVPGQHCDSLQVKKTGFVFMSCGLYLPC